MTTKKVNAKRIQSVGDADLKRPSNEASPAWQALFTALAEEMARTRQQHREYPAMILANPPDSRMAP